MTDPRLCGADHQRLYQPWGVVSRLCALYVEEAQRGRGYGAKLIEHVAAETRRLGFPQLHLCTDLEGYYERNGFVYNGLGYHPRAKPRGSIRGYCDRLRRGV